jgi:hypothetical protein
MKNVEEEEIVSSPEVMLVNQSSEFYIFTITNSNVCQYQLGINRTKNKHERPIRIYHKLH